LLKKYLYSILKLRIFLKNYIEYIFFAPLIFVIRRLPLCLVRKKVSFLSFLLFKVFGVRRAISMENLKHAFPEKEISELKAIAYKSFKNFLLTVMESLYGPKLPVDKLTGMMELEDREILNNYMSQENGKIILSAHFGNWEYLGHFSAINCNMKVPAIVKRMRNPLTDKYFVESRNHYNFLYTLYMDKNIKEIYKVLMSGGPIIMLADQSAPPDALYVKFFNRWATVFQGPAVFALKCKSTIMMLLCIRNKNNTFKIIQEEIKTDDVKEPSKENIYELTKRHVELLEKYVRKYPEQWLWSHRRWKHSDKYEIFGNPASKQEEK
jgi:KDO2-lipid IV(A) lauroyltransferase